ncbi:MAG: HipA domain-containing protein [Cytophagaceae bacterium]|jgi:serine/threonine-protein kinase HipA|nr:HipA domain-containing protein [Cytophagaceae bacterium]
MATKNTQREILIYAHWMDFKQPALMGTLRATLSRGKEIFSFEYDKDWLTNKQAQVLDPDLQLFSGQQYLSDDKSNFGIFLDSSPDRWGRLLMRRKEAALARKEKRNSKDLHESDYLLGVFDGHRMGGLRFKETIEGAFLSDNRELASPPWTSLRELEHASLQLEREDIVDDPDYLKWLNMLIAPGSSLGGARPKASVLDTKGHLWIAKFPSRNDNKDIGAWEMVVQELAVNANIKMAEAQVQTYNSAQHTFLTKRFDRTPNGDRIHFASAMTMLGYNDGTDHHDGVSYLELAEFILRNSAEVEKDLEQLWRRIVFSICVTNTDDHLRNHGFLLTKDGWRLSPAYDINPVETGTGLKLNISEDDNSLDIELAIEVAKHFRLTNTKAKEIVEEVISSVTNWKKIATKYRISRTEQELMSKAFRIN